MDAQTVFVLLLMMQIISFLAQLLITERLKVSLQKEHSEYAENLKWGFKIREQAAGVAEYLALARSLKEDSSEADYRKANQMSWELAMWLPEDIYKEMTSSIVAPSREVNELSTVLSVRKLLLHKNAGNLTTNDIAHHAPGIGKRLPVV